MGVMAIQYDSPAGQVRLLIPDTAEPYLFTDVEINAYLSISKDNIKRAAANALDAVASSTVVLLKLVNTDDLTVDGADVGIELSYRVRALREGADADDLDVCTTGLIQILK